MAGVGIVSGRWAPSVKIHTNRRNANFYQGRAISSHAPSNSPIRKVLSVSQRSSVYGYCTNPGHNQGPRNVCRKRTEVWEVTRRTDKFRRQKRGLACRIRQGMMAFVVQHTLKRREQKHGWSFERVRDSFVVYCKWPVVQRKISMGRFRFEFVGR